MTSVLNYEIVSPDKLLKDAQAAHIVVPGVDGDFGVLANHAPMMSTMRPGVLSIYESDSSEAEQLFVKGGLVQVSDAGMTILAEEVIDLNSVDTAALEQQMSDTQEDLEDSSDEQEKARLQKELDWMTVLQDLVA